MKRIATQTAVILTLLALLLPTVGAWEQGRHPIVGTEDFYFVNDFYAELYRADGELVGNYREVANHLSYGGTLPVRPPMGMSDSRAGLLAGDGTPLINGDYGTLTFFTDGTAFYVRANAVFSDSQDWYDLTGARIDPPQNVRELPEDEMISDWALEDINTAYKQGLVPVQLQQSYRQSCTRGEFCEILLPALEQLTGKSAAELIEGRTVRTFSDCESEAVRTASALEIVNGYGGGIFQPDRPLSRQDAAAMLARAAAYLGYEQNAEPRTFADSGTFPAWSASSIQTVSALDCGGERLMNGVSDGRFDPVSPYTVEQAVCTVLRLTRYEDLETGGAA